MKRVKEVQYRNSVAASLVEYTLLLALIAMVCLAAVTILGEQISTNFSELSSDVESW